MSAPASVFCRQERMQRRQNGWSQPVSSPKRRSPGVALLSTGSRLPSREGKREGAKPCSRHEHISGCTWLVPRMSRHLCSQLALPCTPTTGRPPGPTNPELLCKTRKRFRPQPCRARFPRLTKCHTQPPRCVPAPQAAHAAACTLPNAAHGQLSPPGAAHTCGSAAGRGGAGRATGGWGWGGVVLHFFLV